MALYRLVLVLLTFSTTAYNLQNQLISSPFDNFRIECSKSSGAVRISVRMVGSQGFIRQDIVFAVVCDRVDELYPWYGIPMGIAQMEREDCYYSHLFDPIVDTESSYTCRSREYISGITRLSDTRVQMLCCHLRTRDEINCEEQKFSKPIGSESKTEIFYHNKLINSVAVEGHSYRVRFCDLTPRAIGLIYDDVLTTTTTTTTINPTPEHRQFIASGEMSSTVTSATARGKAITQGGDQKPPRITSPTMKHIIRIFRPSALYNFGDEDERMWDLNTLRSYEDKYPKGMKPYQQKDVKNKSLTQAKTAVATQQITSTISPEHGFSHQVDDREFSREYDSLLDVERIGEKGFSSVTNQISDSDHGSTDRELDDGGRSRKRMMPTTKSSSSTSATQQTRNHSAKDEFVRLRSASETVPKSITSPQTTTSPSLILLKPLSTKTKHSEATTLKNKLNHLATKLNTNQRIDQASNQVISTFSNYPLLHTTTDNSASGRGLTTPTPSFPIRHHVDEETNYSPFEDGENLFSYNNKADDWQHKLLYGLPLLHQTRKFNGATSNEFKSFSSTPTNKLDNDFNFPTFGDENIEETDMNHATNELLTKKLVDGSRTYVPGNQKSLKAHDGKTMHLLDLLDKGRASENTTKQTEQEKREINQEENVIEEKFQLLPWNNDLYEELLPMNDYEVDLAATESPLSSSSTPIYEEEMEFQTTNFSHHMITELLDSGKITYADDDTDSNYDRAEFYQTPTPKRPLSTEKVLTFCTKEIAIRDRHNLVIACGSGREIWRPFRCPPGSECFLSGDSTYRICCAVAKAVRYFY